MAQDDKNTERRMFGISSQKKETGSNAALMSAWDALDTRVVIADAQYNVIYMNRAVREFLKSVEPHIRKDLPGFDVSQLIGKNLDVFHKNPAPERAILSKLNAATKASVHLSGLLFGLTLVPLRDPVTGERSGV